MTWNYYNSYSLDKFKKQKIFEMYINAYKSIGVGFSNVDDFFNYYNCSYILYENDNQIFSVIMYWVHNYGYKIGVLFSDGSQIGKLHLIEKLAELIDTKGWFVELSDAPEHIMKTKKNKKPITIKEIIYKITGVSTIFDDGSYIRKINGNNHKKSLFGRPCQNIIKSQNCGKQNICDMDGGSNKISFIKNNQKYTRVIRTNRNGNRYIILNNKKIPVDKFNIV